ncbi:MAG: urea transporter [Janthinobacterium lividum]
MLSRLFPASLRTFGNAVLRSYSLLFFSQHRGLAVLVLAATLLHPASGLAGLAAAALAVAGARRGGFACEWTDLGAYSFNALLVGLALGARYAPGGALAGLVVVGAGLALLLSVALGGWLGARGLPFLSLPFVAVVWLLGPCAAQLPAGFHLVPSEGNVFWLNDLYAIGGPRLAAAGQWLGAAPWPPALATYLRALSAIVLQDGAWAGLLVAAGLLWHSRIAFSLSVLACGAAWGVAAWGGAEIEAYNLGANYIMTAVAVGAVFVVPSGASYAGALASGPVVAVLLGGLGAGLARLGLPVLSLPFCGAALLYLYALLLREQPGRGLVLVPVQRYSPEANLYLHLAGAAPLPAAVPLGLPFLGAWRCTQGYADGGPTHQGPWGQALDFAIADADGHTYRGPGLALADYYCYDKPVLAPADGVVEAVVQHLPDNLIGEVDTRHNWGNTVVVRHAPGLYSQLSHLRPHSVPVRPGDAVRRGDVLGHCGSSGRSPEPHLHFQVQATAAVGSATRAHPLAAFLVENSDDESLASLLNGPRLPMLRLGAVPTAGDVVRPAPPHRPLAQALRLPPGHAWDVRPADAPAGPAQRWEVFTDAYNHSYLRCHRTGAVAYFAVDEGMFRCTAYYGPRTAWLYRFYCAAYRVPLAAEAHRPWREAFPLTGLAPWGLRWLQDAVAPFGQFLRADFEVMRAGAPVAPAGRPLRLRSQLAVALGGRRLRAHAAELLFEDGALVGLHSQGPGPALDLHLRAAAPAAQPAQAAPAAAALAVPGRLVPAAP